MPCCCLCLARAGNFVVTKMFQMMIICIPCVKSIPTKNSSENIIPKLVCLQIFLEIMWQCIPQKVLNSHNICVPQNAGTFLAVSVRFVTGVSTTAIGSTYLDTRTNVEILIVSEFKKN